MRIRDLSWLSREIHDISRRNTYIRLCVPLLLVIIFFFLCFLILPGNEIMILGGLMVAYFIPPSGKESIIPIGIGLGIPWWLMALTLTLLDVITALFMIMNFALMLQVPRLGPWIEKTTATSREFMAERPWMNRWRIPGLALFVMLPLQGTGGVGATVLGLMAGLTPGEILLAVGIGDCCGKPGICPRMGIGLGTDPCKPCTWCCRGLCGHYWNDPSFFPDPAMVHQEQRKG